MFALLDLSKEVYNAECYPALACYLHGMCWEHSVCAECGEKLCYGQCMLPEICSKCGHYGYRCTCFNY